MMTGKSELPSTMGRIPTLLVYILAVTVSCIQGEGTNSTNDSKALKPEERIIGGEFATPGEFPHQIVMFQEIAGTGGGFLCGGSLINEEWILTAAHCVTNTPESNRLSALIFIAGKISGPVNSFVEDEQTNNKAQGLFIHLGYVGIENDPLVKNDIALIKLTAPFELNERVKIIQIDEVNRASSGTKTTAIGWGRINPVNGDNAPQLKKATILLPAAGLCEELVKGINVQSQICVKEMDSSVCSGDSGGPLLCNDGGINYVCGIASFAEDIRRCIGGFTVFTRVFYYKDWIKEILAKYSTVATTTTTTTPPNNAGSRIRQTLYKQQLQGIYVGTILVSFLLTR